MAMRKHETTIRECYKHAAACARQAQVECDPKRRERLRDLERDWEELAHRYEYYVRNGNALNGAAKPSK